MAVLCAAAADQQGPAEGTAAAAAAHGPDRAQIASVALAVAHRLVALALYTQATAELAAIRTLLCSAEVPRPPHPLDALPPGAQLVHTLVYPHCEHAPLHVVLEAQMAAVQAAAPLLTRLDVGHLASLLTHADGPIACALRARHAGEHAAADRAAAAVERATSLYLQRVRAPAEPQSYRVRIAAMRMLAAPRMDADAFWDRVARINSTFFRHSGFGVFPELDAATAELCSLAAPYGLLQGKGFQNLCERWLAMARECDEAAVEAVRARLAELGTAESTGPRVEEAAETGGAQAPHAPAPSAPCGSPRRTPSTAISTPSTPTGQTPSPGPQVTPPTGAQVPNVAPAAPPPPHTVPASSPLKAACTALETSSPQAAQLASAAEALQHVEAADPEELSVLLRGAVRQLERRPDPALSAALVSLVDAAGRAAACAARSGGKPLPLCDEGVRAMRAVCTHRFDTTGPAQDACSAALELAAELAGCAPVPERALLLHHVSSNAYHFGSRLYVAQQYGGAARLLVLACQTERDALACAPEQLAETHRWAALLPKKYEVLVSALRHAAQPERAVEAALACLRGNAAALEHAGALAARHDVDAAFRVDERLTALGSVLAALWETATCTLLHPQGAQDRHSVAHALSEMRVSPAARGAVLEHGAAALWPFLGRDECAPAVENVLRAALACYPVRTYPLRHARVALQVAELRVLLGMAAPAPPALAPGLDARDLGQDAALLPTRAALACRAHLLRAAALLRAGGPHAPVVSAVHAALGEVQAAGAEPDTARHAKPGAQRTLSGRRPVLRTPPRAPPETAAASSAPPAAAPPRPAALAPLLLLTGCALHTAGLDAAAAEVLIALQQHAHSAAGAHALVAEGNVALAGVWLAVGHTARAGELGASVAAELGVPPAVRARALLVAAAASAEVAKGWEQYDAALEAAAAAAEAPPPAPQRALFKCEQLEVQACAADTYAALQLRGGNGAEALRAALHALRTRLRCAMVLGKLAPAAGGGERADAAQRDVFAQGAAAPPPGAAAPAQPRTAAHFSSHALATLHARATHALYTSYAQLSTLYARRGAARNAEAFARECAEYAGGLPLPTRQAQAAVRVAELEAALGRERAARASLERAHGALDAEVPTEAHVLATLAAADLQTQAGGPDEALRTFASARTRLAELRRAFRGALGGGSARGGRAGAESPSAVYPALDVRLAVGEAEALLAMGRAADAQAVLNRAPAPRTAAARLLQARLHLADAARSLEGDAVWGVLPEMATSLPSLAVSAPAERAPSAPVQRAVQVLGAARLELEAALAEEGSAGDALLTRGALEQLLAVLGNDALVQARGTPERTALLGALANAAVSVTVRREWAEGSRGRGGRAADAARGPADGVFFRRGEAASEPGAPSPASPTRGAAADNVAGLPRPPPLALPAGAAALTIALTPDRRALVLSRTGEGLAPAHFTLPIGRQCAREGEEEPLTVDAALGELRSVVAASNASVHSAKDVHALEARKAWWGERRALDARLGALLESIENTWLGGFRGLLAPLGAATEHAPLERLRQHVEGVVRRACGARTRRGTRSGALPPLDPTALACLAALPSECAVEDLEDWLHYAMDMYQVHGVPVAQDEVDVDELCLDLRAGLEELHRWHARTRAEHRQAPSHLYLVLDRELCELPWESLPALRARSVSRVPSLELLAARLAQPARLLDVRRTAYLLNPSSDLARSEERFGTWLAAQPHWHGTVGHPPVADEVARALAEHDTFLYFGHAGGEQYVRPSQLHALPSCAVAMLWGCSSGVLRRQGRFDPAGTPHVYMRAGAPALLANLWDTTDRELDSVCDAVLQRVGLRDGEYKANMTLPDAVSASRSACRLPYLTGAACVVYGIPVRWAPQ